MNEEIEAPDDPEIDRVINYNNREPLKSSDGTMLSPWKQNTILRRELLRLSEFVPVMLKLEKTLQDDDPSIWWHCWSWDQSIEITPKDEEHARKIVGKLIFAFGKKPSIKKVSDDALESFWLIDQCTVVVKGYKPKTCRYEEIEIKVPAQRRKIEKKVIPAVKAHVEKRRVLVCDDVKVEPQKLEEVEAASEVPF